MTRFALLLPAVLVACGELHLDAFAREPPSAPPAGGVSGNGGRPNGAGGTSTSPTAGAAGLPPRDPLLIDDFEDQDKRCSASDGFWYQSTDGTGVPAFGVEATNDRPGSGFALHASGVGFTAWGSLVGVNLAGTKSYFDATGYQALRFWARASAASTRTLTVSLLETNLHYQTDIELGQEWREYVFPFGSAKVPEGAPPFDPAVLSALQFFVLTGEAFDFWLDDLTFTTSTTAN